jgi:hypothetical protein
MGSVRPAPAPSIRRSAALHAAIVGLLVLVMPAAHAGDDGPPAGFVPLFNGRNLSGWKVPEGDGGHWKVVEGVIDYDAQSEARGDKSLWSEKAFGDFVLRIDWRLKEAPYLNQYVPYILPDGSHARDYRGQEMHLSIPDADSGILLRGSGNHQVNIWCWPIGSGELMYGLRSDQKTPSELRTSLTPRTQADKPVGEWNRFEITVRGDTVKVVLNDKLVIPGARLPELRATGPIGLQHHGLKRGEKWTGPPSLIQYKNIFIKDLKD